MPIESEQEKFDRLLMKVGEIGGSVTLNDWPDRKGNMVPQCGANYSDIARMLRDFVVEPDRKVEFIIEPRDHPSERFPALWKQKGDDGQPKTDLIRFDDGGSFIFDPPSEGKPYLMIKNILNKDEGKIFSIKRGEIIGAVVGVGTLVVGILTLTEPNYRLVTSEEICGFTEKVVTKQIHEFEACENPNKITGYKYAETISGSSGYVGGGHDQNWHCNNLKRAKEAAIGMAIVWGPATSSENSKKDTFGKVRYKYSCSVEGKWDPIYEVERWDGCAPANPISETIREPKTCFDETDRIGWKWRWQ